MVVIWVVWWKSYEQYGGCHAELAREIGFSGSTISTGHYWDRHQGLGILPFLFFLSGLVGQLVHLGVISGKELFVYSTLLKSWYRDNLEVGQQKYGSKKALFDHKILTILCYQTDLRVIVWATTAHVHDSQVGWVILILAAFWYGFSVIVVYENAVY